MPGAFSYQNAASRPVRLNGIKKNRKGGHEGKTAAQIAAFWKPFQRRRRSAVGSPGRRWVAAESSIRKPQAKNGHRAKLCHSDKPPCIPGGGLRTPLLRKPSGRPVVRQSCRPNRGRRKINTAKACLPLSQKLSFPDGKAVIHMLKGLQIGAGLLLLFFKN